MLMTGGIATVAREEPPGVEASGPVLVIETGGGNAPRSGVARGKIHRLTTLRLVREGAFPAPAGYPSAEVQLRAPRDVYERMAPYAEREAVEVFWLLALNAQHRLIGGAPEAITRGILNSSLVHPREVFLHAIVARAAAIILCHNHPSGDPSPSPDDRAVHGPRLARVPVDRTRMDVHV